MSDHATTEMLPTDLDERLKELKKRKEAYEVQSVDANIAELEKLIAERDKVLDGYGKAYDGLKRRQSILEDFKESVEPDFETVLLPNGGTQQVNEIVQKRLGDVNTAHRTVDDKKTDVSKAESDLETATKKYEIAAARLDQLRGLPKTADTRLKALESLRNEINALKASGDYASAYWLLTGTELRDEKGHVVLSGDRLFSGLLSKCAADPLEVGGDENLTSCPAVIETDKLKDRLQAAFAKYQLTREAADAAKATHETAKAELKDAEKTLATLKKDLEATIRKWLAAYPNAPEGASD